MVKNAPPHFGILRDDLGRVLERTRDVWDELRGQRIFVTGGTGFIGKWLLETFAYANETLCLRSEMLVLTRDPRSFVASMTHLGSEYGIRYHRGDVRDFDFPDGEFSHIIHGAADASAQLNETSPLTMFDVIVTGTRRVLEFAATCRAEKLLLLSSGAVYGVQPPTMTHVDEDYLGGHDPMSRFAAYGEGKRVAEMLCAFSAAPSQISVLIARCFAFVGPYQPLNSHFAIGNFLGDALANRPIAVKSDGRTIRSYLYAADLACWLWSIFARGEHCRPYNVGSDEAISILDAARAAARLPSQSVGVRLGSDANSTDPPPRYVPSVDRARRELGLDVNTDFDSALQRTFRWHQQGDRPLEALGGGWR
jgi:dTDP-glucose 4,6-dehydratase